MKQMKLVNKKVKAAYAHNLVPILCCGESLEERENGTTNNVIEAQIKVDIAGLTNDQAEKLSYSLRTNLGYWNR